MLRKDFEFMAKSYRSYLEQYADNLDVVTAIIAQAKDFCELAKRHNARFDRRRFLDACGIED